MSARDQFEALMVQIVDQIGDAEWNDNLTTDLASRFPPGGETFEALRALCENGIETGWMGLQGDDTRKGARVIEPGELPGEPLRNLSVDVVELADIVGPHHAHPGGEICAVMEVTQGARFDGNGEGWVVYPPGSSHWPSAEGGRLRVMFFLPGGKIEYIDRDVSLRSGSSNRETE